MTYPLYDLLTKIRWLMKRNIPLSENNTNKFMQIINSSPDFSLYEMKLTGIEQDNSFFYYQVFNECLNNQALIEMLQSTITINNVRDAIEYVGVDNSLQLTQYCIDSIFTVLGNYPQFEYYSNRLKGLTPETTQNYIPVFNELLYLQQFIFDISRLIIPNED